MTNFDPGDIVSVEFPYSDLQGRKRRPGLVLSGDDEDLLLARITTRPAAEQGDVALSGWSEAGLPQTFDGQTRQAGHCRSAVGASAHWTHRCRRWIRGREGFRGMVAGHG
jgi:hypothetical protein